MREVISLHIGQAGTWDVEKEEQRGREGKNENARETRCAPRRERTLRLPLPFVRVAPLAFLGLFRLVLDLET